jgi:hypothetical protein
MDRRAGKFPVSIALVGLRDLRDYIIQLKGGAAPNPGSPFNVKSDSACIGNFSRQDVAALFAQRTAETGQKISRQALDYVYEQSGGQPWIVNNLFKRVTMRVLARDDYRNIGLNHVKEARQQMIEARETHLDSLEQRLHDPQVRHVIQAVISGSSEAPLASQDHDVELTSDLGLIRYDKSKGFVIANPVYEELLTRFLGERYLQASPSPSSWRWQTEDGKLDMDALLKEFQKFWRRNSDIWGKSTDFHEVFPHLLLMGFLQRVTNGTGTVHRESAAGTGRMDISVEYKGETFIIEIKVIHSYDTPKIVREEGLEQIARYRDTIDKNAPSYLVIFDRRAAGEQASWEERITWEQDGPVTVLGC